MSDRFMIGKNDISKLNVFFYKPGVIEPHKPMISHIRIDSSKNIVPAWHIGYKHATGKLEGSKVVAGTIMFEVPYGMPLQEIMFTLNRDDGDYYYALEDLPEMDLYILNKFKEDEYGELVVKNLKFFETRIEQGTKQLGRYCVAPFIADEVMPFNRIFSNNKFIRQNYDNVIIKDEKEMKLIISDLTDFNSKYPDACNSEFCSMLINALNGKNSINPDIDNVKSELKLVFGEYLYLAQYHDIFSKRYETKTNEYQRRFSNFTSEFYRVKNFLDKSNMSYNSLMNQPFGEL